MLPARYASQHRDRGPGHLASGLHRRRRRPGRDEPHPHPGPARRRGHELHAGLVGGVLDRALPRFDLHGPAPLRARLQRPAPALRSGDPHRGRGAGRRRLRHGGLLQQPLADEPGHGSAARLRGAAGGAHRGVELADQFHGGPGRPAHPGPDRALAPGLRRRRSGLSLRQHPRGAPALRSAAGLPQPPPRRPGRRRSRGGTRSTPAPAIRPSRIGTGCGGSTPATPTSPTASWPAC